MHIPLLSNIILKKHLSHPGVPEEALALVQEMRTYLVKTRGSDEEGFGISQEFIEIAGRKVSAHCLAALNGIAGSIKSKNKLEGDIYFAIPPYETAIQLCGPYHIIKGTDIHQITRVLSAAELWLSAYISASRNGEAIRGT